tara:strand:- start:1604 stop:3490 length:1887 start_codon:yes stop_codon:yes gene_type:complete
MAGLNTKGKMSITELDFDTIKGNLKTYLKGQTEFTDFDFEGSGMSVLLDTLAYNTHYNAFMANMAANEMFLDTAVKRNSVTSHAKTLGYTPVSATAATAYVDVAVNDANTASVLMPAGYAFNTTIDGVTYQFVNTTARTLQPTAGVYNFANIDIHEGSWVTTKYTVNTTDADQRFILNNDNVDISTLLVQVVNSASDSTTTTYTKANNLVEVKSTTTAYFVQETLEGEWEVYFGDGVVGKSLIDGNIVNLSYVVTNGTAANGAKSFSASNSISGFSNITVTTVTAAANGAIPEGIDKIKYNAPFSYAAQNRTVTASDYKAIIPQLYSNIKAIAVWGGEFNSPAVYGKVYLSILPNTGTILTTSTKSSIVNLLADYNVVSVTPVVIDLEITKVIPTVNFKFDANATSKTKEALATLVTTAITNYSTTSLEKFEQVFRYSPFTTLIDEADPAILSNITTIKISKTFTPTLASALKYTLSFSNNLYHPYDGYNKLLTGVVAGGILSSSGFTITGDANTYYLEDDGSGLVFAYYVSGTSKVYLISGSVGTIDYLTGDIVLTKINIASVGNVDGATSTAIRLTVQPASNDVVPVRNQILQIDSVNLSVTGTSDTIAAGAGDAGVNYSTTATYS